MVDDTANMIVVGVGPDASTVTNANGAKQSHIPYRADLLPPLALLHISGILAKGAEKYGDWNWLGLSVDENVNHMMTHVLAWGTGDTSDDHPGHAACRALMALERYLRDELAYHANKAKKEQKPEFGFVGTNASKGANNGT